MTDTARNRSGATGGNQFPTVTRKQEFLLAFVCDNLCKHRDTCRSQEELEETCAACALEALVRWAAREERKSAADQTAALLQYIREHGGAAKGAEGAR